MPSTPRAPQQFVIVRSAAASSADLFEALTSVRGMQAWVPACRSAVWRHPPGVTTPGLNSVRVLTLAGGVTAEEEMVHWDAGRQINYRLAGGSIPLGLLTRDYEGVTRVEPTGPNASRLIWSSHFNMPGALALIRPAFRPGLRQFISLLASGVVREAERLARQ